jgi:hypothetical protein
MHAMHECIVNKGFGSFSKVGRNRLSRRNALKGLENIKKWPWKIYRSVVGY